MAKTSSKEINLEAVHSALLEVKSTVSSRAVESESRSRSRKDFQPEESESES